MQWFYARSMRCRIIACNRQQRWPYKILIEKLQELEEKPYFTHVFMDMSIVITSKNRALTRTEHLNSTDRYQTVYQFLNNMLY